MNNDERIKMITKEIMYDLVTLDSTHAYLTDEDSAEVSQHGLMVSRARIDSLPENLQVAIRLYAAVLENSFDYLECDISISDVLIEGITIFVSHMLKTGALRLGNV